MKDMLNEVNGRRLRVDHPSHIVDTFEGIALLIGQQGTAQIEVCATYLNKVERQIFKLKNFTVDGVGHAGLVGNIVIFDLMIQVGDEVSSGRTFNKSKRLKRFIK